MTAKRQPAAPDQQGDIGALPAPVGMQFVEDQEAQALRSPHQFAVLAASEQQLQHHVVGQEDIGRLFADGFPDLPFFLPGKQRKPHRRLTLTVALFQEFFQFFRLAVGQGVHRIHHDGLNALARTTSQDVIDNRDDVRQAFS